MEVVESKKITTKFGNKVNLVIRAGSMTARNKEWLKHRSHGQDWRSRVVYNCISVPIGDYPDSIGNLSLTRRKYSC